MRNYSQTSPQRPPVKVTLVTEEREVGVMGKEECKIIPIYFSGVQHSISKILILEYVSQNAQLDKTETYKRNRPTTRGTDEVHS